MADKNLEAFAMGAVGLILVYVVFTLFKPQLTDLVSKVSPKAQYARANYSSVNPYYRGEY